MKRIESLGFCSRFFLVGGRLLSTFFPPPLVEKGEATGNAFSSLILAHTFPALSRLRLAGFVPLWTSNVDNFTCLVS